MVMLLYWGLLGHLQNLHVCTTLHVYSGTLAKYKILIVDG